MGASLTSPLHFLPRDDAEQGVQPQVEYLDICFRKFRMKGKKSCLVVNESGQQTACMHVPGNTAQLLLAYPAYPAAEAVPGIIAPSKRAQFEAWGNEEWTLGIFSFRGGGICSALVCML